MRYDRTMRHGPALTALAALITLIPLIVAAPVAAEEPEIVAATVTRMATAYRVDVTVRHPDTGWDHYADGWEVLDGSGARLGYRPLHHPHVDEQPFTRSLTLDLPEGTREVFIRAHCPVDGWGAARFRLAVAP